MPKGNWMYGDNLGKEENMSKVKADSVLEYTSEELGDPITSELKIYYRVLKGLGQLYVTLCTVGVSLYIIIRIVRAFV